MHCRQLPEEEQVRQFSAQAAAVAAASMHEHKTARKSPRVLTLVIEFYRFYRFSLDYMMQHLWMQTVIYQRVLCG